MTTPIYPPQWWLTVPEICADLKVSPDDLADWATNGLAPVPELGPDGVARVHRADYEAWLESLADDPGTEGDA